ncbi:hypothetical protein FGADI_12791 [Fusarium gaditjirri]|uniref:Uncharacterized protein n=1 Tax=Fusarium gaditjirri TaxID=282569 RepID=A0A8H4SRQ0_9HYPO|nr:hypothetical protein FGADI_12791 [Fusarium gaditjirri]
MNTPMMHSPTFEPPFVIDKIRDKLQVRLRNEHLEGYLLINLPKYDPMEAMKAAMLVIKSIDITSLKKEHGRNSSAWMSLTGNPWCPATTLSGGIHFTLPLAAVRETNNQLSLASPANMRQGNHQINLAAPPSKPLPVGLNGTKRARPEDDDDENPSPKRPNSQGFAGWFPWGSRSPESQIGN